MLTFFARSCRKTFYIGNKLNYTKLCSNHFATLTSRDFISHYSHGEIGSLNTRFVKYIALENVNKIPIIPQKIKYSEFFPVQNERCFTEDLYKTPITQIPRLIIFTNTYKSNGDPYKLANIINQIDNYIVQNLPKLTYEEILSALYSWMYLIPNKITRLEFYKQSIRRLVNEFEQKYPKNYFVQVCFYLSLYKKNRQGSELLNSFIKTHLDSYINELTTMDFAIVASSAYKAGIVIQNEQFRIRLKQEMLTIDTKDDSLFITFIKSLRLNKMDSHELYVKLKEQIISGQLDRFQFKGITHTYMFFASGLWNDKDVCQKLMNLGMNKIKSYFSNEEEFFNDLRAKDIATFLFSNANLGPYYLSNDDLKLIENLILEKYDNGEYQNATDELYDSVYALWLIGYYSKSLVDLVFDISINHKFGNMNRVKLDSRFKLLTNCIKIEKPEWYKNKIKIDNVLNIKNLAPDYLIKGRQNLQNTMRIINENKTDFSINNTNFTSPINELNIAGIQIEFDDGRKLNMDVLETSNILKFENQVIPLINLKKRLLECVGINTVWVGPFKENHDEEILIALKNVFSTNNLNKKMEKMVLS